MIKQLKMLGKKIPDCSEDLTERNNSGNELDPIFFRVKGTHSDDFKMH